MADAIENTVALDGQTTTTTDNAILRYDTGNSKFEGVTISASQLVGRSATGDTRGMSAATARQTIGVGSAAPTNNQFLYWASASSQYVQAAAATARSLIGLGTASPTNNQALFYTSASSQYEQKSAATARAIIGIGTAAPTNSTFLQYASASSQYVERSATGSDTNVVTGTAGTDGNLAQWNADGDIVDSSQAGTKVAQIHTGTYVGDGSTSQSITGVGFQPTYVKIWNRVTTDGNQVGIFETTNAIIDDSASGGAISHAGSGGHFFNTNTIISLNSDGFTVDDDESDENPNKNGLVYNYLAMG